MMVRTIEPIIRSWNSAPMMKNFRFSAVFTVDLE